MAIVGTLPVTLQNGTTADATQVMTDLNFIANQVNANAIATGYISPGSLVSVQVFSTVGTSTYTPNGQATKAIVRAVGGGGAGGGCGGTGPGLSAVGGGGASGSYGEIFIASGLASVTVTVGAGGTAGALGAPGNSGGSSSFGALLVASGGQGGGAGSAITPPGVSAFGGNDQGCSGTGVFIVQGTGSAGSPGVALSATSSGILGAGGDSIFGGGGNFLVPAGHGFGSGGLGQGVGQNSGAGAGFAGFQGIVIVFEFA